MQQSRHNRDQLAVRVAYDQVAESGTSGSPSGKTPFCPTIPPGRSAGHPVVAVGGDHHRFMWARTAATYFWVSANIPRVLTECSPW